MEPVASLGLAGQTQLSHPLLPSFSLAEQPSWLPARAYQLALLWGQARAGLEWGDPDYEVFPKQPSHHCILNPKPQGLGRSEPGSTNSSTMRGAWKAP